MEQFYGTHKPCICILKKGRVNLALLCIVPKNRPRMVPIAGFLKKSSTSTFYLQFIHISSFFQIFPKTYCAPTGKPRSPYALIALASVGRPADDRERPCFRPGRAYANFLLLLAAGYMRLIFPGTRPPDRYAHMAFDPIESDRHFKPRFFKC